MAPYRLSWVDYRNNSHSRIEQDDPTAHREAQRLVEEDRANMVFLERLPDEETVADRLRRRIVEFYAHRW